MVVRCFTPLPSSPTWEPPSDLSTGSETSQNARFQALSSASRTLERLCMESAPRPLQEYIFSWKCTSGPHTGTLQPDVLACFNVSRALGIAVGRRRTEIVRLLLAEGLEPNKRVIEIAMVNINMEIGRTILAMLLQGGWDINTPTDAFSASLVTKLVHDEYLVAWCLSHGADPNATSPSNRTLLHSAASVGTLASLRLLVDAGGTFTHPSPSEDIVAYAVLSHRETRDKLAVISFLIERGANLDAYYMANLTQPTGMEGLLGQSTALHLAIWYGKQEMVELLVRGGANMELKTKNVFTKGEWISPWELAKLMERNSVLEFLEKYEIKK